MARVYLHCVLLACGVISLHSQEITGSISGEIRDSTGAVMPGVRVTVRNMETNVAKSVLTGPSGTYRVPFIIFGRYSVSAESPGFKVSRAENVQVSTSEEARVDLTLSVGEVNETVTVDAQEALLKTEEASVSTTVTNRWLPSCRCWAARLSALRCSRPARTSSTTTARHSAIPASSRRNGVSLSVNGLTDLSNKFYYDGIEGMNFDGGTRAFDPSLEAVQEVKVLINSNSAEYGGAAGATVNIVTRSGTNQFHGHAYDYLQNDKLNAFQLDAKTLRARQISSSQLVTSNKPVVRNNIFGSGVGGPIRKDRLFFFANYEGIRGTRAGQFGQRTVPTTRMRNGDFSRAASTFITRAQGPAELSGSGTGFFPDPANMKTFFDPVSLKILNLVPLPTNDALVNNFQGRSAPLATSRTKSPHESITSISRQGFVLRPLHSTISTTIWWAIFFRSSGPAAATAVIGVIGTTRM